MATADGAGTDPVPEAPDAAFGRRRRYARLILAGVAVGGLALDSVIKALAVKLLDPADPVVLLDGWLRLQLIRNPGAAFSLGQDYTIVFALLSAAVLVFVLLKLVPQVAHSGWAVALGLLLAGVSSNLSDRMFRQPSFLRGHVVDYLQLPRWPIFNLADVCITSAAVLIAVLMLVRNVTPDGKRQTHPAAAQKPPVRPPKPKHSKT